LERGNPETGEQLRVVIGTPEGAPVPDLEELPEEFAPGITKDHYLWALKRLQSSL
jgi:Mn-containing catalase